VDILDASAGNLLFSVEVPASGASAQFVPGAGDQPWGIPANTGGLYVKRSGTGSTEVEVLYDYA
jgi:hypothetical protein